jgi:hypothetical protein
VKDVVKKEGQKQKVYKEKKDETKEVKIQKEIKKVYVKENPTSIVAVKTRKAKEKRVREKQEQKTNCKCKDDAPKVCSNNKLYKNKCHKKVNCINYTECGSYSPVCATKEVQGTRTVQKTYHNSCQLKCEKPDAKFKVGVCPKQRKNKGDEQTPQSLCYDGCREEDKIK